MQGSKFMTIEETLAYNIEQQKHSKKGPADYPGAVFNDYSALDLLEPEEPEE